MAMTPGPDFTIITQQTLKSGKQAGFLTILGMVLGLLFHALLASFLSMKTFNKSFILIEWTQYAGIIFLFYLGITSLFKSEKEEEKADKAQPNKAGFYSGLIINLLNPKIFIFYLSILPQFIQAEFISFKNTLLICSIHITASVITMSLLVVFLSHLRERISSKKFFKFMQKLCGLSLIFFSVYLSFRVF